MNFVFFSPQFPQSSIEFCCRLAYCGATVLGIGDVDYGSLSVPLKAALTEYYKVDQLEDYESVLRAVGYFTHKYGKIDRFESLNEYWLELEAKIRADFNITGVKTDFIDKIRQKSKMKDFFHKAGVDAAKCEIGTDIAFARTFIAEVGYPVIVKPDQGCGASFTYRLNSDSDLESFFLNRPEHISFILEEYIDGIILTYDGLVNSSGEIVLAVSHRFEQSVMDVVNTNDNLYYFCLKDIYPEVESAGRRIVQAFDLRERFFHIELFKSRKNGGIYALEINMRPPGAWMTDAINYSYNIDVYAQWAGMVVKNTVDGPFHGQYYTGYASRKDHKTYLHSHEQIFETYAKEVVRYDSIEDVFSRAMGNRAYQFRAENFDRVKEIAAFIQREA